MKSETSETLCPCGRLATCTIEAGGVPYGFCSTEHLTYAYHDLLTARARRTQALEEEADFGRHLVTEAEECIEYYALHQETPRPKMPESVALWIIKIARDFSIPEKPKTLPLLSPERWEEIKASTPDD